MTTAAEIDDRMRRAAALVVAATDNDWDKAPEGQMITALAIWEAISGIHDADRALAHARHVAAGQGATDAL